MIPVIHRLDVSLPGEGCTTLLTIHDPAGEVIATLQLKHSGRRVAEFSRLYVTPAHQRKGYGRALVSAADRIARQAGCQSLACTCRPCNMIGQSFYRALGFLLAYQFSDDDLLMARALMTPKEAVS